MRKTVWTCLAVVGLLLFANLVFAQGGADTIKLGVAITTTGPQSAIGRESQRGLEVALKEINDAGGIKGKKIEHILYDEKGDPEQALRVITRLIEQDKVHVIFGPLSSNSTMAVGAYVNEAQIPAIGPAVGVVWLRQGWDYYYRATSNTYVQAISLVDMMQKMGMKKLAVLNINEEYGNTSIRDIKALVIEKGYKIEFVTSELYRNGDTDFTAQSARIARSGADGLVVIAWANDLGSILKQVRQAGFTKPIYGDNSFPGLPIRNVAGAAADNSYFTTAYIMPDNVGEIDSNPSFSNPIMNKFLKTYYATFKELPSNDNAYRSYDAIYIIAEALKNAKSLSGPDIRNAIENIQNLDRLIGKVSYKGNKGEGVFKVKTFKIEKGRLLEINP